VINMKKLIQIQTQVSSPTLNTVLMVERTLTKMSGSIITIPQLKRMLPKQVNHNTLMTILDYLERSNKIAVSIRGISWIFNSDPNLKAVIAKGFEL
jgi:hypothetical protein